MYLIIRLLHMFYWCSVTLWRWSRYLELCRCYDKLCVENIILILLHLLLLLCEIFVTSTTQRAGGQRICGTIPVVATDICILWNVHTISGTNPTPYLMGTGGSISELKRPELTANNLPTFDEEVRNERRYLHVVHTKTLLFTVPSQNILHSYRHSVRLTNLK
jgi:hypothetical protein